LKVGLRQVPFFQCNTTDYRNTYDALAYSSGQGLCLAMGAHRQGLLLLFSTLFSLDSQRVCKNQASLANSTQLNSSISKTICAKYNKPSPMKIPHLSF